MKVCPKCQKQFSDDANFCPVDAARLVAASAQAQATDTLTARFTLGDRLGGSRTGTVYRATDKQTNAAVAVKVVSSGVTSLPGVAQRLERELKQIERVQSAGVAKVVASGKRSANGGEESWVAVELLDGAQTLAEAISARGPIPLEQAAHLIEVVGEALIEAAQVGVVHRDLAPKNVLFAGQDIKLINFSLPVPTNDRVPGVPEFVAPEQVDGKPVDQRSNLYSLGALYYYVLTGQTPHTGATADEVHRAHANATIKTPSSLAPVPAPVEAVIMRALDRSPTKRFLTVRQFVDEVGRIARGDKSDPKVTQPMGKANKPKAELVQTLLGVRSGGGAFGTPAITAAPTPHVGTPAATQAGVHPTPGHLSAPPMAQPVAVASNLAPPQAQSGAATMMGVPSGAAAAEPAKAAPSAAPQQAIQPERSPWAPPATVPPAAVSAPPEMPAPAQPVPAASPLAAEKIAPIPSIAPAAAVAVQTAQPAPAPTMIPAAPVLPQAPVVAPPKVANAPAKAAKPEDAKGKFRETMWFKKGDLDAQAAQAAAEERERTGKEVAADKADSLPMDERYKDDGSISRGDKEKYSLRTGATQMMSAVKGDKAASSMSGKVSEDELIGEMKKGRGMWVAIILVGLAAIGFIIYMIVR
jgi:serine/threonine-protein kinase